MKIKDILTNYSILPKRLLSMKLASINYIFLIFCIQFVNCAYLTAQDFPTPIIGNDLVRSGVTNASPGKGVSIEYFLHPSYNLNNNFAENGGEETADVDSKKFIETKLKIPLANKDAFRMLLGFSHTYEKYDFNKIEEESSVLLKAINDVPLRRTRASLIVFLSLNHKNYFAFRAETSFNGNYEGIVDFDKRYRVYRGALIYGVKKQPHKEIAWGLTYNNSFERTLLLPFLVWNQTFNDKWGIETVLPLKITVRRNFKHNDMLLFGTDYWSSGYSMDIIQRGQVSPDRFIFKSSALHLFVDYQKRLISDWTWISLKTGWAYNFDSRFIQVATDTDIDAFPSNNLFISLGFFVSPPDRVQ